MSCLHHSMILSSHSLAGHLRLLTFHSSFWPWSYQLTMALTHDNSSCSQLLVQIDRCRLYIPPVFYFNKIIHKYARSTDNVTNCFLLMKFIANSRDVTTRARLPVFLRLLKLKQSVFTVNRIFVDCRSDRDKAHDTNINNNNNMTRPNLINTTEPSMLFIVNLKAMIQRTLY